jgi:hypothetical protein
VLQRVDVTNNQNVTLSLPFGDVSNGYLLSNIDGLDPVKATIVTSSFASMDGVQEQSVKREARNLIFHFGYEPDFATVPTSVTALRNTLYNFFMPKSLVTMRFYSDDKPELTIIGRVETFANPLFTATPGATIGIMCTNPDFVPDAISVFNGSTVGGSTETILTYNGTVDTGFTFRLPLTAASSGFTIYHRSGEDVLSSLQFTASLLSGDVLNISTIQGAKSAILTRSGSNSSLLYGVSPFSKWLTLTPGPNYIRVVQGGVSMPYSIQYSERYGAL